MTDIPIEMISACVALLWVALLGGIVFRKIKIPYTIGLVVVGMSLYALGRSFPAAAELQRIHLTPNLILYILLPTLIFDAAIHLDCRLLFRNIIPILLLAIPGVLIATVITGLLTYKFTVLSFGAAMIFGALISTTDPVAVIALFNELGAPKRLTMLVDAESLFNDATAIVMFDIVCAIVAASLLLPDPRAAWSLEALAIIPLDFVWVFFGGAGVGALCGWLMIQLLRISDKDPLIEIALSTALAYAVFVVANYYLKFSGVMAACGAGVVVNHYARTRLNDSTRLYLKQFWGFASFLANSTIFLLLGLSTVFFTPDHHPIKSISMTTLVGFVAILIARGVILGLTALIYNPLAAKENRLRGSTLFIMWWSGLRGALPLALAVSIPAALLLPNERLLIIHMTLGIVLFTLVLQGATVPTFMRLFGLNKPTLQERMAALHALEVCVENTPPTIQTVCSAFSTEPTDAPRILWRLQNLQKKDMSALHKEALASGKGQAPPQLQTLWLQANEHQRATYSQNFADGFLTEQSFMSLTARINQERAGILANRYPLQFTESPTRWDRFHLRLEKALGILAPIFPPAHKWQTQAVLDRCATFAAMRQAYSTILEQLPIYASRCRANAEQLAEFEAAYQSTLAVLKERVNALSTAHPKLYAQWKNHILKQGILNGNEETLRHLCSLDLLDEPTAARVSTQFQHAILTTPTH